MVVAKNIVTVLYVDCCHKTRGLRVALGSEIQQNTYISMNTNWGGPQ